MFTLPQTVGYAIRALACLDGSAGQRRTAKQIAGCTDIPLSYLSKILRAMVTAGLVDGQRGHKGGFYLTRKPQDVSLTQVIAAIDPSLKIDHCLLGMDACAAPRTCPLHHFWTAQRSRIERKLATTSLAAMARQNRRPMIEACGGKCGATRSRQRPTASHPVR